MEELIATATVKALPQTGTGCFFPALRHVPAAGADIGREAPDRKIREGMIRTAVACYVCK